MKCSNCGKELEEGTVFCSECGQKVSKDTINNNEDPNSTKKKSKNFIWVIIIVVIIVIGIIAGGLYYKYTVISDEYVTEKILELGFDQFDATSVDILDIEDINYKDFNKIVLVEVTARESGLSATMTAFLLVNKMEDRVQEVQMNNNIIFILNGVAKNKPSLVKELTKLTAEKIISQGEGVFSEVGTENFKNLINSYSDIVGLEDSRKYIKTEYDKQNTSGLDTTLLFEKGSPMIKYMAFYMTTTKFNTSYPFDERTYQYFANDYSYRDTLNTLEYVYGPAYVTVQEYQVYKLENFDSEADFQNLYVGSYTSLDSAKQSLNVEE